MVHTLRVVEGRSACYERREGLQTSANICVAVSRGTVYVQSAEREEGRKRVRMRKEQRLRGRILPGMNSQVYVYNLNYKFDRVTEA